jgi:hypothetical protein
MKNYLIFAAIFGSTYAGAAPVSTISCDSYMEYGIASAHEKGTFTYVANPFKVSVTLTSGEVILSDSTHLCRVTRDSVQYSTQAEGDGFSSLDITFTSLPNGDPEDGGHISLGGNQSGLFTCVYLRNEIELSNCSVK